MLLYRLVEIVIVGGLVSGSALWLLGLLAPTSCATVRLRLAVKMNQRGRPSWLRALASRLAAVPIASAAGCGTGCSSCGGCGLSTVAKSQRR